VKSAGITLIRPTEGLQIAYDPRIPKYLQAFEFVADGIGIGHKVQWVLNGEPVTRTDDGRFLWPVERGHYTLIAKEMGNGEKLIASDMVHFLVK
jgi:penicillin-binding protein 1C